MSIKRIRQYFSRSTAWPFRRRFGCILFDIALYWDYQWSELTFAWDDVKTTKGRCIPGMIVRVFAVLPWLVWVLAAMINFGIRFAAHRIDLILGAETDEGDGGSGC